MQGLLFCAQGKSQNRSPSTLVQPNILRNSTKELPFPLHCAEESGMKKDSKVSHLIDNLKADVQPLSVFDLCYRLKVNQSANERGTFL
jgi:hypothetical protein